jgi:hypothetical protein
VIESAKPVHNPELLLILVIQAFRPSAFKECKIAESLIETGFVMGIPFSSSEGTPS